MMNLKAQLPLWFAAAMVFLTSLLSQTRLSYKTQLRDQPTIAVIERQVCSWSDATHNCSGLEYYRFRLSDNTIVGPFIAIPPGPISLDPNKWTPVPISVLATGGTRLPANQIK